MYSESILLLVIEMGELLLRVPYDVRREFEMVFGKKVTDATWQLLFSRFLNEELREKSDRIKRIESIVSRSKLTERQAKELADEVSLSIAKRFLSSAGIEYSEEELNR
jgi:uncharacterized protein YacL (UPF0231 family)